MRTRILVVDDDPYLRKTLLDILKAKGYEAIGAATGAEALAAMKEGRVSLALIDLMLPDQSGLEVMEGIKAISHLTEALILTGHASLATAIEATRKGAFSYIVKPYDMDDLLLNIRHGIDRYEAQVEILRLASYPRLNPNPIIEVSSTGEIIYINPAGEEIFPSLISEGTRHPLLERASQLFDELRQSRSGETIQEVVLGNVIYELHLWCFPETGLIQITVMDITERKQAEMALARRERKQAGIAELGAEALGRTDLMQLYGRAATLISRILTTDCCVILESKPASETLHLHASFGRNAQLCGEALQDGSAGTLTGFTLASEEAVTFSNLRNETRFTVPSLLAQCGFVSGVSVATGPREKRLGMLAAFAISRCEFGRDDLSFVHAVANVLASAAQRTMAEEEIRTLAKTDSLTGLANRREFGRILEEELQRSTRYQRSFSVIMFDIDHFKRVNDTFGHEAGDGTLREFADIIRANMRKTDVIARWGGEEFMILLPECDLNMASKAAEKLRVAIAERGFQGVGTVTASFGVSTFIGGDNLTSLIKRADDALYSAKKSGRNRVEVSMADTAVTAGSS